MVCHVEFTYIKNKQFIWRHFNPPSRFFYFFDNTTPQMN